MLNIFLQITSNHMEEKVPRQETALILNERSASRCCVLLILGEIIHLKTSHCVICAFTIAFLCSEEAHPASAKSPVAFQIILHTHKKDAFS